MQLRINIAVLLLLSSGCVKHEPLDATAEETGDDEDTDTTDTDTGTITTFTDCSLPPPETYSSMRLDYPGEEFVFDAYGNFVTAVDWADTVATMTRQGAWDFIAPHQSDEMAGVDMMANGDLIIADEANGTIVRMTMEGGETIVDGSILSPNSLAVSNLGLIYTTAYDELYRINPETDEKVLLVSYPGHDLDGVAFSPDYTQLWFNHDDRGHVYRMDLDENGDMVDVQYITEFNLSWQNEIDGMTTDMCGNLYAVRTDGKIIRYLHDGTQEAFLKVNDGQYSSALHFGSGIGGWERDHLYMMDRTGTLYDIDVGIPGAPEAHLP